jgi:uncharacterized protein YkwD
MGAVGTVSARTAAPRHPRTAQLVPVVTASPTAVPVRHDTGADAARFVELINRVRATFHLRPLAMRADLVAVARRQSARMAAKEQLWHDRDTVNEISDWLSLGENVGWSRISVQDLHDAFMASPEHRRNILDPSFTSIGVGETVAADGRIFVAEEFAQFGR